MRAGYRGDPEPWALDAAQCGSAARRATAAKILDAAYQVTRQGPPAKGPHLTKDADGNPAWAYDYKGTVDGVEVKTTVLGDYKKK